MESTSRVPFVLRGRTPLPAQSGPGPTQRYDDTLQLWIDIESGRPLVSEFADRQRLAGSDFGETMITETGEGHDQAEGRFSSDFGETVSTRTSEGTDQREFHASDFGETMQSATAEGHDQRERISSSDFGETIFTKTSEGVDQSEGGR